MAKRRVTPDELRLWRAAMGEEPPADEPSAPAASSPEVAPPRRRPVAPAVPIPGPLAEHDRKAIRRGRLPVEARVDLHGMTQAKAQAALTRFLKKGAAQGLRCVLVITGKGGQTGGRADDDNPYAGVAAGVLRSALPQWLEAPELAPLVIGSASANPRDGGVGARYVLLRRSKPARLRASGPG